MPNDLQLQHERMRWRTMSHRQLLARLGRITDITKLRNFIQVASEYPYRDLYERAVAKLHRLLARSSTEAEGLRRLREQPVPDSFGPARSPDWPTVSPSVPPSGTPSPTMSVSPSDEALAEDLANVSEHRTVLCTSCARLTSYHQTAWRLKEPYCSACVVLFDQRKLPGQSNYVRPKEQIRYLRLKRKEGDE